MPARPVHPALGPVTRFDSLSTVGLAAMVAALHLAVLAGRVSARHPRGRHLALIVWQQPPAAQVETAPKSDRVPSNPTQAYNAGRLALTFGVAVIALAYQLQVMRMGSALGR